MNKETILNKLTSIERIVKELKDSIEGKESNVSMLKNISTNNTSKKEIKLVQKDSKFLSKLIKLQKAKNASTDFLENLLDNGYDTLTQGQYDVVVKIANDLEVGPDEQ